MLIPLDGLADIHVTRAGTRGAPPLVFLHGVGLDLTWWGDQFAAFGAEHDVIALDMPNHGLSGPMAGKPGFTRLAQMVADVLATLETGPAHIIGLSVGGMIAQTLALRHPACVQSLTLVGTLCIFPEPVRDALRQRAAAARRHGMRHIAELTMQRWFPPHFHGRRPDVLDRANLSLHRQDAEFHASMWDMIAELDLAAQISAITCPTLVITGEADPNAPPEAARQIANAIAGAELHTIPGIGHHPQIEAPETFNTLLRNFLKSQADGV